MRNTILAAAFTALAAPALACGDVGTCTSGFNTNLFSGHYRITNFYKLIDAAGNVWNYFQVKGSYSENLRPVPRPTVRYTHSIQSCNNSRCTKAVAKDPMYYDRASGSWATGRKYDQDGDLRPCGGNSPYGAC